MELRISLVFLVISSTLVLTQDILTNTIDDTNFDQKDSNKIQDDPNPFAEAAQALLQNDGKGGPDLGGMMSNFIQSDEGKQLGGMIMGAAMNNGAGAGQLLSGLGAMLNNNNAGAALDPSMIGNVLGMLAENSGQKRTEEGGMDMGNIMELAGGLLGNSGLTLENSMGLLPQLLSTLNSFVGPEAKEREDSHSGHAWFMPPVLEKMHVLFDHFAHSELGKSLWKLLGADKFFNTFSRDGKFDFAKFFELLENHSFRRHWIQMVTGRITDVVALVSDPKTHKKYINTGVTVYNGFLKSFGFPKTALLDLGKPTETITAMVNYFFKRYLDMKVTAKQYVQPAVRYIQEVISLAQNKGILLKTGIDSRALSHKLTDTLNLEIIEPLARVYRAYRFAKKVPECDKYVMCLVNQEDPNEVLSLPGLKPTLSRSASVFVSWFLSGKTGTSFWTLYTSATDEKDCSIRFVEKCNDFHIEEIKVTTEYQHNEL